MKIEEIENPEFKNYMNLAYMQGENNNREAVLKIEQDMKEYIDENPFIISVENGKPVIKWRDEWDF